MYECHREDTFSTHTSRYHRVEKTVVSNVWPTLEKWIALNLKILKDKISVIPSQKAIKIVEDTQTPVKRQMLSEFPDIKKG